MTENHSKPKVVAIGKKSRSEEAIASLQKMIDDIKGGLEVEDLVILAGKDNTLVWRVLGTNADALWLMESWKVNRLRGE